MSRPVQRFQFGAVGASVFQNTTTDKDGKPRTWHSVTIDKVYTGKDGQPHSTNSFDADDLPKVELAAAEAYKFVLGLGRGKTHAESVVSDRGQSAEVAR